LGFSSGGMPGRFASTGAMLFSVIVPFYDVARWE
jgi:hypothetical protein